MNQRLKRTVSALFAVTVILSLFATPALAAGASGPLFSLGLGQASAPDEVSRYTDSATPGIIVELESGDDMSALEQWANSSDEREVLEQYDSDTALITAPPGDVTPSRLSLDGILGSDTVSDLGYVTSWSWDRKVEYTDPIKRLESSDAFTKPAGSLYAETLSSGEYTAGAMAWSDDAPESDLTDARDIVGADEVSATGDGVDVAVIDSGVNFGNGSIYGNGTAGSDYRVTDAYDFVDSEEPNLSVSRSNLTAELAKVGDPNGHGSWVSSAVLNAKTGIAPNASLMAYRALDAEGQGSTSDIKAAVNRADSNGADIIVMSLGTPMYSDALAESLKHALSADGNVTGAFVAVGNSYMRTRYVSTPADVETVIGVTATNTVNVSSAKKAYFANIGPDTGLDGSSGGTRGVTPDTAAPGMNISAPVFSSPYSEGGYETNSTLSGTSMAAPIAAGVGALVLDADPGLIGEPGEFHDRIVNSGAHTPNLGVTESEGGMVNATRAITGYDGADAPDRDLPSGTEGRDSANRILAGDVGVKMAGISEFTNGISNPLAGAI